MAYFYLNTEAVAEADIELVFPKTNPVSIASTAIGKDKQTIGMGIVIRSCL